MCLLLSGEGRPEVTGRADPPEGSSSSVHTYPATRSPPTAWLLSGNTKEQRHSCESILYHSFTHLLIWSIFSSHHFVLGTIPRLMIKDFYFSDEHFTTKKERKYTKVFEPLKKKKSMPFEPSCLCDILKQPKLLV